MKFVKLHNVTEKESPKKAKGCIWKFPYFVIFSPNKLLLTFFNFAFNDINSTLEDVWKVWEKIKGGFVEILQDIILKFNRAYLNL